MLMDMQGNGWLRRRQWLPVTAVLAAFVCLGVYLLSASHAASPIVASEPENGTQTGSVTTVKDTTASNGSAVSFNDGTFAHPGIVLGKAQLDFVKAKLAVSAEPWTSALANAKAAKADAGTNIGTPYSSLTWTPHPRAYVGCGSFNNPNEGCYDETTDAMAAYTDALLWYYTGDTARAQKAIEIMNAWSNTLVDHKFDTTTYTNGLLQSAWGGEIFPKAAEIIRYTYTPATGQPSFDIPRFSTMLRTAYLPHVINGWSGAGANWLMSMAEATMNIGIFLNDRTVFNNGVADWRDQVPAVIYMKGDVNRWPQLAGLPISPPGTNYDKSSTTASSLQSYWHNPASYTSGLEGETCRDINHTAMGLGAMINGAETARLQGIDLYGEQQNRITSAMELNTGYISAALAGTNPPAGWLCPAKIDTTTGAWKVTWEIAYNQYAHRMGLSLPKTSAFLTNVVRPANYRTTLFMQYETLTSFDTP
jgi:hypothetical protein